MLEWRPVALAGFWAIALSFSLAALVFLTRPDRPQNRWLAAFLVVNALYHGASEGFRMVFVDPRDVYGIGIVVFGLLPWVGYCYLVFLSTLDSPLATPLRSRTARVLLFMAAAVASLSVLFRPDAWFDGLVPWRHVGGWQYDTSFLADATFRILVVFFIYGVVAAAFAYRRAKTPVERRRMGWYLAAFATHDVFQVGWLLVLILSINAKTAGPLLEPIYFVLPALTTTVLGIFLSYGILQAQLFDIDLRIKRTLKRSTIAAAFVAAFFVGSELASSLLSERLGVVAGVVVAGALVFFLAPLQDLAQRVADTAMPNVTSTDAYLQFRRMEVYKAAVTSAVDDGEITAKERNVLDTLREQLTIAAADADAVEQDVLRSRT